MKLKKYSCVVFVKHPGVEKKFLFSVDPLQDLPDNQEVLVETKNGRVKGVTVGSSFLADHRALNSIMRATDAYYPLKRVVGVYETIYKPLNNADEPAL